MEKNNHILAQFIQSMLNSNEFSKSVPKLFFDFIEKKFGYNDFISKYYESYLFSIKQHKDKDSRLNLFTQFLGQGKDPLPINIFKIYLNAIDVSGYIVSGKDLFLRNTKADDLRSFNIKYRHIFKIMQRSSKSHFLYSNHL